MALIDSLFLKFMFYIYVEMGISELTKLDENLGLFLLLMLEPVTWPLGLAFIIDPGESLRQSLRGLK